MIALASVLASNYEALLAQQPRGPYAVYGNGSSRAMVPRELNDWRTARRGDKTDPKGSRLIRSGIVSGSGLTASSNIEHVTRHVSITAGLRILHGYLQSPDARRPTRTRADERV